MNDNISANFSQKRPRSKKPAVVLIFLLLFFAITLYFAKNNWWFISDSFTMRQNPPSAEIAEIANKTSMNDTGRRIFYASLPETNTADIFNQNCSGFGDSVIVLGCFTNMRIFILDITNPATANARYFTAAHEMLHAAYARLSVDEKNKINLILESEYQRLAPSFPELQETMALYAEIESGEKHNELHSILGTEYANLSTDLEEYYLRYFTNRQPVVALATDYKKVFQDIQNQRTSLQNQMDNLQTEITYLSNEYDSALSDLNTDIASFNACADISNCFSTQSDFNFQRANLINRQNILSDQAVIFNDKIDLFNELVDQFNQLGGQAQILQNSVNSRARIE